MRVRYGSQNDKINGYLHEVQEHILSNLKAFQDKEEEQQQQVPPFMMLPGGVKKFVEYKSMFSVDNSQPIGRRSSSKQRPPTRTSSAPLKEKSIDSGTRKTDFTHIKAGSLLRAQSEGLSSSTPSRC